MVLQRYRCYKIESSEKKGAVWTSVLSQRGEGETNQKIKEDVGPGRYWRPWDKYKWCVRLVRWCFIQHNSLKKSLMQLMWLSSPTTMSWIQTGWGKAIWIHTSSFKLISYDFFSSNMPHLYLSLHWYQSFVGTFWDFFPCDFKSTRLFLTPLLTFISYLRTSVGRCKICSNHLKRPSRILSLVTQHQLPYNIVDLLVVLYYLTFTLGILQF